jgi:lipopolysaccharide export system protein LptA
LDTTKPISIAADRAEVDNKQQIARFVGNVVALQDTAVLNADSVLIQYERESEKPAVEAVESAGLSALTSGSAGIVSLVASGSVKMIQNERRAVCEQVIFDQKKRTVTLTGDPRLYSGTDMLQGSRITVHLDDERVEVVGSSTQRVQVTVVPENAKDTLPPNAQDRLRDLEKNPPKAGNVKTDEKKDDKDEEPKEDPKPIVEEPKP